MARGGFFRRIVSGIENIFRREPSRPFPPAPPPQPPPPPPGGGGGGGGGIYRGPYRESWENNVNDSQVADIQERTGYSENEIFQAHFEVFAMLNPEGDDDEQLQMWDDYLAAFVNGETTHDAFFEEWNIDPRDFDWEMWRDAMGYSKK